VEQRAATLDRLPAGAVNALMEAAWLTGLAALHLYQTGLTDTGSKRLTERLTGGNFGRLHLEHNSLGNRAAEALLAWPGLRQVIGLSLYGNQVEPELERRIERIVRTGAE
jgi:hypothetical protein